MTQKRTFPKGLLYGLIIIAAGALFYTGYRTRARWKKEHVLVELRPIQTSKGWGYDILTDGRIFLHQTMIPAIPGDSGFRTKEDALAVGRKVIDRIMAGKVPMVTAEEVQDMGLVPKYAPVSR
jgi:hypothetical protein